SFRLPDSSVLTVFLRRSCGFDDNGDALTTADASRAEAELPAPAPKLVHQVSEDARARGPQRMADGDGAAVDVGALPIEPQLLLHRQILWCEGLVDLHQIEIGELEAGTLERLAHRRRRPDAHDGWVAARDAPIEHARQRLPAVLLTGLLGAQ